VSIRQDVRRCPGTFITRRVRKLRNGFQMTPDHPTKACRTGSSRPLNALSGAGGNILAGHY
jgi:hypothetical protein